MELREAHRTLMFLFWGLVVLSVFITVVYETEWLTETFVGDDSRVVFILQTILELVTIVCIPVSLRLFKWKVIANKLKGSPRALSTWGSLRILLLCVPLLCDTLLYEQTRMPSFGYLAVILLLCLFFIYPSKDRCRADIGHEETNDRK